MTDLPEKEGAKDGAKDGERIAKRIARAGICSRRDAEKLIAEGKVSVDGKVLDTPATIVTAASRITVNGKPLPDAEQTRLFRYHKPDGLVTTHKDPEGRKTIFQALPADLPRLISIGRLDLTSEGLLLLTNDGALARKLELPATGWIRRYRVRVHGRVDETALAELVKGVTVDGVRYGSIEAHLERQQGSNAWVSMSLREGKNREIRRVMEHLGLPVSRLIRVAYGPFQLGKLERGEVEEVPGKVLHEQMGDTPKGDRTGFAKAKPKPKGHTRRDDKPKDASKQQGKDADRRRPASRR
ncbi:MAG: rRNA pseudouridine synthase [Alphaproteobacteria bacterium]|nr:rRNA pseudouridine synthase [Alphaproteobacteria bacterium]MBU0795878.1 rRNA pseudouridine synthase [Alphaproteobacteria bacterium]MBU0888586.1 rRNA pseudouridine synthase [Alphaproteobacteria bacterium]MBU1813680.1 rRNA pseudouridine synthase [Alphaproteobacteria bacterium]